MEYIVKTATLLCRFRETCHSMSLQISQKYYWKIKSVEWISKHHFANSHTTTFPLCTFSYDPASFRKILNQQSPPPLYFSGATMRPCLCQVFIATRHPNKKMFYCLSDNSTIQHTTVKITWKAAIIVLISDFERSLPLGRKSNQRESQYLCYY